MNSKFIVLLFQFSICPFAHIVQVHEIIILRIGNEIIFSHGIFFSVEVSELPVAVLSSFNLKSSLNAYMLPMGIHC